MKDAGQPNATAAGDAPSPGVEALRVENTALRRRLEQAEVTIRRLCEGDALAAAGEAAEREAEFLATLAHELRNPMSTIAGAAEVLRMAGDQPETARAMTEVLDRQSRELTRLVEDLADLGRARRRTLEIRREEIGLDAVVEEAVAAMRDRCRQLEQPLRFTPAPSPLVVLGSARRLAQAIGHLLTNACKFTGRGGGIDVSVERQDDEAVVRVRDSGVGIPPEYIEGVFDLFARGSRRHPRAVPDIGLALTRTLIEMHGGHVLARSDDASRGCEFIIRLPLLARHPEPPAGEAAAPAAPWRILVVDDNRDAADSLATLLRLAGYDARTAYDGPEAVDAAADYEPDAILLDIGLPGMSGHDAARRIRDRPSAAAVLLIALSGRDEHEERERSAAAGFDHHLAKPVDFDALHHLLTTARGRSRETPEPAF